MVFNIVLSNVVQSSYPSLLYGIRLHDYGLSFRNMPASDKSDIDDDHQGYGDRECGVEATGFRINIFKTAMCRVRRVKGFLCF